MTHSFQSVTSKSLGNLGSFKKTTNGLVGETTFGKLKVILYNESIFRISICQDQFEDFSYSVVGNPSGIPFEIIESSDTLVIKTSTTLLSISRTPVRFSFQTLDGKVINEDDALGTSWIGDQVSTYKKLQPGERFIGLGEKRFHISHFALIGLI
jgi:alpha-glucosidase